MSVTIKDIAEAAGVSYSTVSKALNASPLVRSDTRERILQLAKEMGYEPNILARSLVSRRSSIIGVAWPSVERLSWSTLVTQVNNRLEKQGYNMLLSINPIQSAVSIFNRLHVDGILVFPGHGMSTTATVFPNSPVPILAYGNPRSSHFPVINAARRKALLQAVSYLTRLGHRQIAYIADLSPTNVTQQEKLKGFLDGVDCFQLATHPEMTVDTGGPAPEAGYQAALKLLESSYRPTAVISGSFDLTTGIIRAFQARNVSIPGDLSLISYDNIPQMNDFSVPITAVGTPTEKLAENIVAMLLDLIHQTHLFSSHCEVDTELVERASVKSLN